MSIDIDWQRLTTGPDGDALAATIRDFIHERFQQVTLPRFIRSVAVHEFAFGDQAPEVEVKDICDPLPDFYDESDDDDALDDDEGEGAAEHEAGTTEAGSSSGATVNAPLRAALGGLHNRHASLGRDSGASAAQRSIPGPAAQLSPLQPHFGIVDHHLTSPVLSRSSTPGLPGSTPGWGYFVPRNGGLSGTASPLVTAFGAASAAPPYPPPWQHHTLGAAFEPAANLPSPGPHSPDDLGTRPSTAASLGQLSRATELDTDGVGSPERAPPRPGASAAADLDGAADGGCAGPALEPDPEDAQVVLRVRYRGPVRLALTAAILLNYPMPSFVELPLRLTVTGLRFDGVALLAYLRRPRGARRAHFCFLGPEDARVLVGAGNALDEEPGSKNVGEEADGDGELGGLLREMRVESEIGQREGGKQVLKNVGKVEKFVLEQVRHLFEDEFVYPSRYTFLV